MPCDRTLKPKQTISERKTEIVKVIEAVSRGLIAGTIKPNIGPQGAIAFVGLNDQVRDGVTDACMYRRLMSSGSALAKQAIMRAEQLAGRSVNRQAVAQGAHAHFDNDGDITWHDHK